VMFVASTLRTGVELGGICGLPVVEVDNTWLTADMRSTLQTSHGFTFSNVVRGGVTFWQVSNPNLRSLDIFFPSALVGRIVLAKFTTTFGTTMLTAVGGVASRRDSLYANYIPQASVDTEYWQWSGNMPVQGESFYVQNSQAFPVLTLWNPTDPKNRAFKYLPFPTTTATESGTCQWKIGTKINGVLQHVGNLVTYGTPSGLNAPTQRWYAYSQTLSGGLIPKGSDGKWVFSGITGIESSDGSWRYLSVGAPT
jgi:hypothetical protein